jgi:hypothetical protein
VYDSSSGPTPGPSCTGKNNLQDCHVDSIQYTNLLRPLVDHEDLHDSMSCHQATSTAHHADLLQHSSVP